MNTLENAIRKIDAETRDLLSAPSIPSTTISGACSRTVWRRQARLIITGDEILDSGVQVMAQPPGKKNQTIHLLSGGEKRSPPLRWCSPSSSSTRAVLPADEVDAPLTTPTPSVMPNW